MTPATMSANSVACLLIAAKAALENRKSEIMGVVVECCRVVSNAWAQSVLPAGASMVIGAADLRQVRQSNERQGAFLCRCEIH